jgi:fibronectin-binding autotransporter adhesin
MIKRPNKPNAVNLLQSLLTAVLLLTVTIPGHAQNSVWDGDGFSINGWSYGPNWVGGTAPVQSQFDSYVEITGNNSPHSVVDVPYTITSLTYTPTNGGSVPYTLSGDDLTVNGSYTGLEYPPGVLNSASSLVTIDNNIKLVDYAALTFGNSGGGLALNGNIKGDNNTTANFVNTSPSGKAITVNGSMTGGYTVFESSAPVILTGDNHAASGTLREGVLELDSDKALPSAAPFSVSSVGTFLPESLVTGGAYTISDSIIVYRSGSGTGGFYLGGDSADKSNFTGNVTLGAAAIPGNSETETQPINLTATAGGTVTFSGNILHNTTATIAPTNLDNVTKVGLGTVILAGTNNTYTGTTTVQQGALFVTGKSSGGGSYTVENGAILGGPGGTITVNAPVTLQAGASLSVSGANTPFALSAGKLTLNVSILDIVQALSNTSPAPPVLSFALNTPTNSDEVAMGARSLISIGSGLLSFNKTSFTPGTGFGVGTYILIDSSSTNGIIGTLAPSDMLTGKIGDYAGTLEISTDSLGNEDLVLNVVPEPSEGTLLIVGISVLAVLYRKKGMTLMKLATAS